MKKAAVQIAVLALVLIVVFAVCRRATGNTYMAVVPGSADGVDPGGLRIDEEVPDIVESGAPQRHDKALRIPIHPEGPGRTYLDLYDEKGRSLGIMAFRVNRLGIVYDYNTGGFTGDNIALAAFMAFCLLSGLVLLRAYRQAKGPAFYAYSTIFAVGFSLFLLLTSLTLAVALYSRLTRPDEYMMSSAYGAISSASWRFMMATAPLLVVFAVAMSVSNVALIRHEGFRMKNVLGIGVSLALVAGEVLAFHLYTRDFSGSEWEARVSNTLNNVFATAFVYFECMLIGASVCALKAARHVPEGERDYIIILGCRLRRDGTPTPLLRGRVDRAVDFWQAQQKNGGKRAVLVPSGGQGADEVVSEAASMERYLLERGVPGECIMTEAASRNTYENMENSRAMIERIDPGARVAFATTNYHVFRSGVWASLAGLSAEGMGSRTKWWYWPNAFMRECAGLLLNRIRQELALLAVMLIFFGSLSMVLV